MAHSQKVMVEWSGPSWVISTETFDSLTHAARVFESRVNNSYWPLFHEITARGGYEVGGDFIITHEGRFTKGNKFIWGRNYS